MIAIPTDLRAKLTSSKSFQEAAEVGLSAMLKIVADVVAGGEYADSTTLLRGTAHLRKGDSYRGVVVKKWDGSGEDASTVVPSATLWGTLKTQRQAVALDVVQGALELVRPGGRRQAPIQLSSGTSGSAVGSFLRMQRRDVTHVLALPVIYDKTLRGMLSLEVTCRPAVGEGFIWTDCIQTLQIITSMMAPALVTLPLEPVSFESDDPLLPVIGESMRAQLDTLRALAQQRKATLLLTGPTGVGKTRLARWCHENSSRKGKPFCSIQLHGLSSEMVMGQLFGVREGAYTGARDSVGLIEAAKGGTLFIDEIDKIPVESQKPLLELLSEFTYRPLGHTGAARKADVRIIVATNRDLEGLVARGAFPEDLYYRIHVLSFRVPSLAERRDEIPGWGQYALAQHVAEEESEHKASMTVAAEASLSAYDWPGNLRQLDNVIKRAYVLALSQAGDSAPVVDQKHVDEALAFDQKESGPKAYQAIEDAAEGFVSAVLAHNRMGQEQLTLDLLEGLGRLIVDGLMERGGLDLKEAFLALGEEKTVEHRNHGRRYETLGIAAEDLRRALKGG